MSNYSWSHSSYQARVLQSNIYTYIKNLWSTYTGIFHSKGEIYIYIYYTNSFSKIYTKELKKIGLEKVLCFFVLGTRLDIGKKVAELYQPCSFKHEGETFKFLFFVANGFIDNVTKINNILQIYRKD